ncbi:hypothetical protein BDC45DRAFT_587916 [Circinella umbellata]|nr:hypothetical protein BDC45DRAFT_587916 [Circinella umbellata]
MNIQHKDSRAQQQQQEQRENPLISDSNDNSDSSNKLFSNNSQITSRQQGEQLSNKNNLSQHSRQQQQQQQQRHLIIVDNSDNQHNVTFIPTISQTDTSTREQQIHQECQNDETRIDPIKCTSYGISAHIFSYIMNQKDGLTAMTVSKRWMKKVPILTLKIWNTIKLIGSRHAVENTLLHRCLGLHVRILIISQFYQQDELFQIMDIAQKNNCVNQIHLEFDQCKVDDYESFFNRLIPLVQKVTHLRLKNYDGVLSTLSITAMCTSIQLIEIIFDQASTIRKPLPDIVYFPSNTRNMFNLLTTVSMRTNFEPRFIGEYNQQQQQQHTINCSGKDLAFVINQSPYLENVLLSCTGDNINPSVINAIAKLNFIHTLYLFYDIEPNHQDGALYSLLSKHVTHGINRTSHLHTLALNVADDTILDLVSRIRSLWELELVNGFNLATSDGLGQFAKNISCHTPSLYSLTLRMFDLRQPDGIFNRYFASIPNLTKVDFTDCYVERTRYEKFLNNAPSLKYVSLPLYSVYGREAQAVNCLKDTSSGRRCPISLLHLDEMDIILTELKMNDKWNPYVAILDADSNELESLVGDPCLTADYKDKLWYIG